jgi:hypothetical protein
MKDKIQPTHLARRAVVYLRQSTFRQVHDNHESTVRQYALGRRALTLGWPPERVQIVDEDLGRSGTTTQRRIGRGRPIAGGRAPGGEVFRRVRRRKSPRAERPEAGGRYGGRASALALAGALRAHGPPLTRARTTRGPALSR